MMYRVRQQTFGPTLSRLLVLVALVAATVVIVPFHSVDAQGQSLDTLEVWGVSSGIVNNPKQWKLEQSTSGANNIGSASAASMSLDDSTWPSVPIRWKTSPSKKSV